MKLEAVTSRLSDYTSDAVIICEAEPFDEPGPRIVFVNEAFCEVTGYSAEEVIGRTPRLLQGPQSDREEAARMGRELRAWRPVRSEMLNYRKDGTPFWLNMSIHPVADEDGWYHYWVAIERDVTESRRQRAELARATARLEHAARHDELTGLLNRRGLAAVFEGMASDCRAEGVALAAIQLDLDRFKQVNDTLGHAAGDAVLTAVADRVRERAPEGAVAARVGGDEFLVLTPATEGRAGAQALADALVGAMRAPVAHDGDLCRFGASAGVALVDGAEATLESIMLEADLAMYRSKRSGRGRSVVFTPDLAHEAQARRRLADELTEAVDRGEFEPFYQIQRRASDGAVFGMEALARWRHPRRGLLNPSQFLEAAEAIKAMHRIDASLLSQVLADQAAWRAAGLICPSVAVNVSTRRLEDAELLEELGALSFEPGSIRFELLESTFLDSTSDMAAWNIDGVKAMGIGVELDDFGTGHSSIASLMRIGPDRIKIDKSFVLPAVTDPKRRRMMELIVEIGATLDIGVTAEGVETQAHADLARGLGCDVLQGFLHGQAMTAQEIAAVLAQPAAAAPPDRAAAG